MFVFTHKDSDVIVDVSETCSYNDAGQPVIHNGGLIIGFPVQEHEVTAVPNEVVPGKYCYNVDNGFYENPDYVEPPKTPEERIAELESIVRALLGGKE